MLIGYSPIRLFSRSPAAAATSTVPYQAYLTLPFHTGRARTSTYGVFLSASYPSHLQAQSQRTTESPLQGIRENYARCTEPVISPVYWKRYHEMPGHPCTEHRQFLPFSLLSRDSHVRLDPLNQLLSCICALGIEVSLPPGIVSYRRQISFNLSERVSTAPKTATYRSQPPAQLFHRPRLRLA